MKLDVADAEALRGRFAGPCACEDEEQTEDGELTAAEVGFADVPKDRRGLQGRRP